MIINLLCWIYMLITIGCMMLFILELMKNKISCDLAFVAAVAVITVYAEVFSLFGGVGILSNILLIVFELIIYIVFHKRWNAKLKKMIKLEKSNIAVIVSFIIFTILLAMSSVAPNSADDNGYHSQAIEWIQKFGVVKGLGNLHFRFAYNSAFLCLQALYSMTFVPFVGQILHCANLFFVFAYIVYCIFTFGKNSRFSDYVKMASLVYISLNVFKWSGTSTDAFAMILFFYIVSKWLSIDYLTDAESVVLICVSIYSCTLKLSLAPSLLLVIYPFVIFLKNGKKKCVIESIFWGSIISIPYLLRNVIISGYLLYPFDFLSFNVPWKLYDAAVDYDKVSMRIFARNQQAITGVDRHILYNYPITKWFKGWFISLVNYDKVTISLSIICAIYMIAFIILQFKEMKKKDIFVYSVCLISYLSWIFVMPLIRYGVAYAYMIIALAFAMDSYKLNVIYRGIVFVSIMFFLINNLINWKWDNMKLVHPGDYTNALEMEQCYVETDTGNNLIFYYPSRDRSDQNVGDFPAAWQKDDVMNLGCFGDTYRAGFYRKN